MKKSLIVFSFIILLIPSYSSCFFKSNIFKTFADGKKVGSLSTMNFDGKNYWFGALFGGTSYRYDPVKKQFYPFDFNKDGTVESVSQIEIVNNEVWFGLYTFGIAVYELEKGKFKFYTYKDGISHTASPNDEKYSKVSSVAYDVTMNRIWVGTIEAGLSYFDLNTKKWFVIQDPMIKNISVTSITVNQDIVVIAAQNGLYYLNRKNNKWIFCGDLPEKIRFDHTNIKNDSIICDLIGKNNKGIIVEFNLNSGKFSTILEWSKLLADLKIYDKYLVLVSGHGVTFYNMVNKKMKTFNTSDGLLSNWVNSVYFDKEDMWVLTQKGISKAKIKDVLKELEEIN